MRVLYVVRNHPEPPRSGGSMRIAAITRSMKTSGHAVRYFDVGAYLIATASSEERAKRAMRRSGVWANERLPSSESSRWVDDPLGQPSDEDWTPSLHASLAAVMERYQPHVVVIDTPLTKAALPTIRRHPAKVVLDSHNVDGPLAHDLISLAGDRRDPALRLVAERAAAIELHTLNAVDAVWACSAADRDAYRALSSTPAFVVPNVVEVGSPAHSVRSLQQILFTGSLGYVPNQDAIGWLLDIATTLRRRHFGTTVVIAGSSPPPELVARARDTPWLQVTGARSSFADLFATSGVAAIPLRAGGGTRLKALEAFAAGLPVVSTSKGIEGLDVHHGEHILVAESTAEFVNAIERYWSDPGLRRDVARAAFELTRDTYSLDALGQVIDEALRRIGSHHHT